MPKPSIPQLFNLILKKPPVKGAFFFVSNNQPITIKQSIQSSLSRSHSLALFSLTFPISHFLAHISLSSFQS